MLPNQTNSVVTYQIPLVALCLPYGSVSLITPPAKLDTFHTSCSRAPDRLRKTNRKTVFALFLSLFFSYFLLLLLIGNLPTQTIRHQAVKKKKRGGKSKKNPDVLTEGFPHFSLSQPQSPPPQSCQGSFHLLS